MPRQTAIVEVLTDKNTMVGARIHVFVCWTTITTKFAQHSEGQHVPFSYFCLAGIAGPLASSSLASHGAKLVSSEALAKEHV